MVKCTYSDGHSGDFSAEWLYKHRMTPEGHKERAAAIFLHQTKAWPNPKEMQVQKGSWEKVNRRTVFITHINKFNLLQYGCGIFYQAIII